MTTTVSGTKPAFAADYDAPIPYMQRTRDYYQVLGFSPYRWAHFADVPFTPLRVPLARARVTLVTTAAPFQPGAGDRWLGAAQNAAAMFHRAYSTASEAVPDLRISHVGYARLHTTAADINTYLPLGQLRAAAAAGRIGALGPRLHGAPTNRSHRVTVETDVPEPLRRCREDGADAVVLVPS